MSDDLPSKGAQQPPSAAEEEGKARRVVAAWQRIEAWLGEQAPGSHATLRPGASEEQLVVLESDLAVHVPEQLRALWRLREGVAEGEGSVFMLGNWALMTLPRVSWVHRNGMEVQKEWEEEEDHDPEEDLHWRPEWIPFCSFAVDDETYGLYLDGATGEVRKWYEGNEEHRSIAASLAAYLEQMADGLEHPAPAPAGAGLLRNRALHWGLPILDEDAEVWRPLNLFHPVL
ncbi:SMI1/KNR4 family protein [Streptomyces sp. AA1529]|uniref:SMI1/KNR4 family protein n=1 Tax=Streptomyces sp. AA1529 TaxID=1203257 RepID=UPI000316FA5A|nr:SMI1/KNR4 family protein [Streptomyces sp. AA1529]